MLCIKLVNYWDKYTVMQGQQNVKIWLICIYLHKMFQLSFTMRMSKADEIYQSGSDISHLNPSR